MLRRLGGRTNTAEPRFQQMSGSDLYILIINKDILLLNEIRRNLRKCFTINHGKQGRLNLLQRGAIARQNASIVAATQKLCYAIETRQRSAVIVSRKKLSGPIALVF